MVNLAREQRVTRRVLGNGYAHEAAEAMRCVREGSRESPLMPLDDSLTVMRMVDSIRLEWAFVQPGKRDTLTLALSRREGTGSKMRIAIVGTGYVADYYLKTLPNHPAAATARRHGPRHRSRRALRPLLPRAGLPHL